VGSIISQDTGVLFGSDLKPGDFKDNNVGKVLDNIHACGASKPFSQIAWQACQRYDLDQRFLHYDTTSVSVHGDYAAYAEQAEKRIAVTHGHSKDKRPDMKQFMMEALCVKGSVPLLGAVLSGNTSDKKANNAELSRVASHMRKHRLDPRAYVYVADSAMVTEDNLQALEEQFFITRLPANYKAEGEAVEAAIEAGDWRELGILAENPDHSKNRPSARYRIAETVVRLYGRDYRAIVAHSISHDKRRTRKLEKRLAGEKGAETNFRFLKDPLIVNDTFLKKPERIEALGFILLLAPMVWNLIQQVLREHLAEHRKEAGMRKAGQ